MLANVHILSQTPAFSPSQRHRKATTTAAATTTATVTKLRLSDVTISITIINMKTKAGLKTANTQLSATTILVLMKLIYLCFTT